MKRILLDRHIVGPWAAERMGVAWSPDLTQAFGLIDVQPDGSYELLAGVVFSDWNRKSIQMHVAAVPGARWMTKSYLGLCFQYAFNRAGVSKILGFVSSANTPARRFDEHLGFQLEATLKDSHPDGDLLIYSMTREQCRWLNIPIPDEVLYGQK